MIGLGIGTAIGSAATGNSSPDNNRPAAVGGAAATVTMGATETETVTVPAAPPTTYSTTRAAPPVRPKPRDFAVDLRIRQKQCFGSAGCDITFQIHPTYLGAADLSHGAWDVTYKVLGGDSGPQLNTFSIRNGRASYDREEFISTGPNPDLRAKAIRVDPA